jgi:hypothetical protein
MSLCATYNGTAATCPPATTLASKAGGSSQCHYCGAGKYSNPGNGNFTCQQCTRGQFDEDYLSDTPYGFHPVNYYFVLSMRFHWSI